VAIRNRRVINKQTNKEVGDAPLIFPFISQQMDQKVEMRKMHDQLEMRRYLEDSDSSFDSYSSVASDRIDGYEAHYRPIIRNTDGTKRETVTFTIHTKTKSFKAEQSKTSKGFQSTKSNIYTSSKSSHSQGKARFIAQNLESGVSAD